MRPCPFHGYPLGSVQVEAVRFAVVLVDGVRVQVPVCDAHFDAGFVRDRAGRYDIVDSAPLDSPFKEDPRGVCC